MEKLNLKKAVKINGELKESIDYDLDALTGADVQMAIKELGKKGLIVSITELDLNYHAALFSIAAGISFDDMTLLGAKDYSAATTKVRDFFLDDSAEESALDS